MSMPCGGRAQNIHEIVRHSPVSITDTQENSTLTEKPFVLAPSFGKFNLFPIASVALEPVVRTASHGRNWQKTLLSPRWPGKSNEVNAFPFRPSWTRTQQLSIRAQFLQPPPNPNCAKLRSLQGGAMREQTKNKMTQGRIAAWLGV